MFRNDYKKGVCFALISLLFVSMQPIIVNSRPSELDAWIFGAMTVLTMALIYFPMLVLERKKMSQKGLYNEGWLKENKKVLVYIGINFGIAQVLFVIAYELAGALSGSLAQQTQIIFGLIFGFLINHEKITKNQIVFSLVLFLGLIFAITQGSFNLIEVNVGIFIMLGCTALWMLAHAIIHPVLDSNRITPVQLAFTRSFLAGLFLISTYFLFFPLSNITLLFIPINIIFYGLMGLFYALDLIFWYKSIAKVEISKASVLVAPMPIVTAFFAFLILGEIMTIYHLIGIIIIITSIFLIVRK